MSYNARGGTARLVGQNVHQLAISHFACVLSKGRMAASGAPAEFAQSDRCGTLLPQDGHRPRRQVETPPI